MGTILRPQSMPVPPDSLEYRAGFLEFLFEEFLASRGVPLLCRALSAPIAQEFRHRACPDRTLVVRIPTARVLEMLEAGEGAYCPRYAPDRAATPECPVTPTAPDATAVAPAWKRPTHPGQPERNRRRLADEIVCWASYVQQKSVFDASGVWKEILDAPWPGDAPTDLLKPPAPFPVFMVPGTEAPEFYGIRHDVGYGGMLILRMYRLGNRVEVTRPNADGGVAWQWIGDVPLTGQTLEQAMHGLSALHATVASRFGRLVQGSRSAQRALTHSGADRVLNLVLYLAENPGCAGRVPPSTAEARPPGPGMHDLIDAPPALYRMSPGRQASGRVH